MPEILFLVGDVDQARNDNHLRLPAAFRRAGWTVDVCSHEAVCVRENALRLGTRKVDEFDLIWPLGFGRQATFFDRMQLLKPLDQSKFVVAVDALTYLHGKHRWLELMPETHTATDPAALLAEVESRPGRWVIKPTAGSYGRDVMVVDSREGAETALTELSEIYEGGYLILQRFVEQIARGEIRCLVAGGKILASYRRLPADGQIANVNAGGQIREGSLEPSVQEMVSGLAEELHVLGAGFAAVDTVDEYLMEINVANPGGLQSLEALTGRDYSEAVVEAILARLP